MSGKQGQPSYLTPGTVVGPYVVEGQVGGGGFGFVYRVLRDGQPYALKIAHAKLSSLPPEDRSATIERLDREIAALKSLHHPSIVRVHAFDRWPELEGGYPYLVMDLVDGTPLLDWRSGATPSLARLVGVFEKVADALAHMHELGIIHRDLKSQNILVTGTGEPFIVDFGIARPKVAYDVTRAAGVGTLTHLTPEYVAFLDSAEARSGTPFDWRPTTDLYALGYVLYEALTGEPPVPRPADGSAKAESELLAAIKGTVPRHPVEVHPGVPEVLDALVMELLEKDPSRRPQEAADVVLRLREAREVGEAAGDPVWVNPFDDVGTGTPKAPEPAHGEETIEPIEPAGGVASVEEPGARGPKPASGVAAQVAARSRSRGAAPVSLPTAEHGAEFQPLEEPAPGPSPEKVGAAAGWGKESQILRRAAAEWGAVAPRARRWPLLAGAGAVVATLLLIALAGRPPDGQPKPRTLLSAVEASGLQAAPILPGATPPASEPAAPERRAVEVTQPPVADLAAVPPAPRDPTRAARQAPGADPGEDVEYGRLTLTPDGRVVIQREQPAPEPSGLVRSRPLGSEPGVLQLSRPVATASPPAPAGPRAHGVAYGAHVQARLLTNLDSRTIASGPVEAMLHVPYVVRGQVILPTRTMVYGNASETGGRFTVRFTRLRLPDDTEVAFEGIAMARDDGKPGLAATGKVGQEPRRGDGLGNKIAKGTGNILLDTITGGTPASIARNAGQAALNHEEAQPTGGGPWAILLDAGVVFDIFVEKAF